MSLKFCANLSFMFQYETSDLLERYRLAKNAGFKAVEVAFPYDIPKELLKEVKERTGLEQVLLNTFPGKNCNKTSRVFLRIIWLVYEYCYMYQRGILFFRKIIGICSVRGKRRRVSTKLKTIY